MIWTDDNGAQFGTREDVLEMHANLSVLIDVAEGKIECLEIAVAAIAEAKDISRGIPMWAVSDLIEMAEEHAHRLEELRQQRGELVEVFGLTVQEQKEAV
jgi:hypothetical protein